MRKIEAGPSSVAIWLSGEPLPDRETISRLVRQILSERALPPWPEIEAECFSGGGDTLILARPGMPRPISFPFGDLEALLEAVFPCRDVDSSLYRTDEGYLLTVSPEHCPLSLYEFGAGQALSPLWEFHGKEQGMCLLEENAIGDLKRLFSTPEI